MSEHYLIFGATGGIGSQLTNDLLAAGHTVTACSRDSQKISSAQGDQLNAVTADPTDLEATIMAVEQAHAKQALNGICNCVGSLMLKPAHLISQDDWHHTITINLTSAFNVVHAATKTLKKPASIVLMSSAAALIGLPNHEAISAAKAGINGLVLAAASSYANRGLRFNAVAPGLVKTPLTDALIKNPQALEISLNSHPLGRLGEAADCSQAIQYLLSPNNSWVSGQILAVDGGLSTLKKTISSKAG